MFPKEDLKELTDQNSELVPDSWSQLVREAAMCAVQANLCVCVCVCVRAHVCACESSGVSPQTGFAQAELISGSAVIMTGEDFSVHNHEKDH